MRGLIDRQLKRPNRRKNVAKLTRSRSKQPGATKSSKLPRSGKSDPPPQHLTTTRYGRVVIARKKVVQTREIWKSIPGYSQSITVAEAGRYG
jgi:hypothetical protein